MTSTSNNEPTITDVLDAVNEFATKTEERFGLMETRFDTMETRFDTMETRLDRIEATMVTKDYLDDKLADLRGDIIMELRHEDKKVVALIEVLRNRNVISTDEAKNILGMKPFPQLSL